MQVSHREHPAGLYSSIPFGLAAFTVELPYVLAQCLLFSIISYFLIGFEATAGGHSRTSCHACLHQILWIDGLLLALKASCLTEEVMFPNREVLLVYFHHLPNAVDHDMLWCALLQSSPPCSGRSHARCIRSSRSAEAIARCAWAAGIMVVYATPSLPIAGVLSSLFFGIWNLFTGFLIGHQVSHLALSRC